MLKRLNETLILFLIGAGAYALIELLFRGYTYWSMAVLGGVLFVLLGGINNYLSWDMPLAWQCVLGAAIVTGAELLAGLVLNVWMGLGIWDYSDMPCHLWGQICPQFSAAWIGLSLLAILLDDWIRYLLWGEMRPHYTVLKRAAA